VSSGRLHVSVSAFDQDQGEPRLEAILDFVTQAGKVNNMINDILLPLTSFPVATGAQTIEAAVAFGGSIKAKMAAIAFEMDIRSPIGLYADPIGVGAILAADSEKSAASARDLLSSFEAIAIGRNVEHDHSLLRAKPIDIPTRVVEEARFRDLTVLPLKEGDAPGQTIAEELIFDSGRPVLILSDDAKRQAQNSFDSIAIAWDFGRAATRAVADALPLLKRGKSTRVFTVTDEKVINNSASITKFARHLEGHGIEATVDEVKSNGRAIGDVFNAYVAEHKVDLLVMGAYGHSKMREFILGGATVSMLSHPPTWILMSH
jgi:nucleotide-binding universal stress UspA family protein